MWRPCQAWSNWRRRACMACWARLLYRPRSRCRPCRLRRGCRRYQGRTCPPLDAGKVERFQEAKPGSSERRQSALEGVPAVFPPLPWLRGAPQGQAGAPPLPVAALSASGWRMRCWLTLHGLVAAGALPAGRAAAHARIARAVDARWRASSWFQECVAGKKIVQAAGWAGPCSGGPHAPGESGRGGPRP